MAYAQNLKRIAYEAERQEEAIYRLKLCFDIYLDFVKHGRKPTADMDAVGATLQLEEAIRDFLGYSQE